jgi:hypothetical protein
MTLCAVLTGLGQDRLAEVLRLVSLGKLRTYQMFDRVKARFHVQKLNQEALRKIAPKLWARIQSGEEELAQELSQAVLVSHLDMIVATLDHLKVPHQDGFFDKDANVESYLVEGWQDRALVHLKGRYPEALAVFYINHLAHEVDENSPIFLPAGDH